MYKIFDFSMFSYLGKLIYIQKSRNKQIFADPCKICSRKSKTAGLLLQGPVQKRFEIDSSILCSNVIWYPYCTSKKYFMFTLIKNLIFDDIKLRKTLV